MTQTLPAFRANLQFQQLPMDDVVLCSQLHL